MYVGNFAFTYEYVNVWHVVMLLYYNGTLTEMIFSFSLYLSPKPLVLLIAIAQLEH